MLENVRGLYTHDGGRTFDTIMTKLHELGYGTYDLLLNSSNFGVPQNRVRLYILGIKGAVPKMSLTTNLGAADSHSYKKDFEQMNMFSPYHSEKNTVGNVLENDVPEKYYCSTEFEEQLHSVIGDDLSKLHGYRLMIDEGISNAELMERAGFSANIITKLKRDHYLSLDTIEKICQALNCGVDDILEFLPDAKEE